MLIGPLQVYLKQISRLSRSKGEFATILALLHAKSVVLSLHSLCKLDVCVIILQGHRGTELHIIEIGISSFAVWDIHIFTTPRQIM